METNSQRNEKNVSSIHRKKKKFESLVNKAKKRKLEAKHEENNLQSSDDGYVTAIDDSKKTPSFTLIGKHAATQRTSVKHYLPDWLRHPIIISSELKSSDFPVEKLEHLDPLLVNNLISKEITNFFPVQYEVMPWILNYVVKNGMNISHSLRPRDICVSAPTGSGKTLAYVLPIIQCLSKRVVPKIRALIVAPVQELVIQISSVFQAMAKGTKLRVEACIGGRTPIAIEQEKLVRKRNEHSDDYDYLVDILVITPGRLVEHLENTKGFDLHSVRFLVMDEADRMFDNIQNEWLYHLERHLSSEGVKQSTQISSVFRKSFPQRLLFSATLSQDPEKLKKLNLFQPVLFSTVASLESSITADNTEDYIGSFTTPPELKEKFSVVEMVNKPIAICELVEQGWRGVLCFTKSAVDAHKLSKLLLLLMPTLKISEISSLLPTNMREDILNKFSSGFIDMLISSDVMARGIDISHVKYVISYDPPKHIKSYIHRVGRTGRAGTKGTALTILTPPQVPAFNQMLHDVHKSNVKEIVIEDERYKKWKLKYKAALQDLKTLLQKEQQAGEQNEKRKKIASSKAKKKREKKKKKKVKKV